MKNVTPYIITMALGIFLLNCEEPKSSEPKTSSSEVMGGTSLDTTNLRIDQEQFKALNLSLISLEEHYFGTPISATGMLDVPPSGRAVISAQIGGYIKNAPLLVGDRVQRGQLLLTIENIEFLELQQQYLEASEQLVFLKSDYERQKELYKEKITSEKSYLKAESQYRQTLATCLSLEKKLQLLQIDPDRVKSGTITSEAKIYAPISGDITEIHTKTGSYVSSSDEIMEIVNTEHMHLELNIFEKDVLKIKKDQPVYFRLPESNSKEFRGEIHLIGKSIMADRTVKVHAHIDESQSEGFVPGMYVQANIITDQIKGMALASGAVFDDGETPYVLALRSSGQNAYVFEKTKIKTGKFDDRMREILNVNDFEPGTRFLLSPDKISEDSLVKMMNGGFN